MAVNKDNINQMWHDWFMTHAFAVEKRLYSFFRILPHDPPCMLCRAPFHGIGTNLEERLSYNEELPEWNRDIGSSSLHWLVLWHAEPQLSI